MNNIIEKTLSNGMKVILCPNQKFVKKEIAIGLNYGSINHNFLCDGVEYDTKSGIAHFLEHKIFEMPYGDAFEKLTQLGAMANAYTTYDKTVYTASCLNNFYDVLECLLDYLLTPYFNEKSVEREKGIILSEQNMVLNNLNSQLSSFMMDKLYPKTTFINDIGGSLDDIKETTVFDLESNYNAFYTPSNMTIVFTGNVCSDVLLWLEKYFSNKTFKTHKTKSLDGLESSIIDKHSYTYLTDEESNKILYAYKLNPNMDHRKFYMFSILLELVFDSSQPLIRELINEDLIYNDSTYFFEKSIKYAYFVFSVSTKNNDLNGLYLLEKIRSIVLDEKIFNSVKKSYISSVITKHDNISNLVLDILEDSLVGFNSSNEAQIISSINFSDLVKLKEELLLENNYIFINTKQKNSL